MQAIATIKALESGQRPDPGMKLNGLGRPSCWNPVLAERIVALTASGASMEKACAACDVSPATVYRWLATEVEGEAGAPFASFREALARAREARANTRLDQIEGIMERLTNNEVPKEQRLDAQTARAAVEGYRVLMELESPLRYGKAITLKGDPKAPLQGVTRHDLSDEALAAIAAGGLKNST